MVLHFCHHSLEHAVNEITDGSISVEDYYSWFMVADKKCTFIVGVLEVVVNVGHKALHKMPSDIRHQVVFTLHLTF